MAESFHPDGCLTVLAFPFNTNNFLPFSIVRSDTLPPRLLSPLILGITLQDVALKSIFE